MAELNEERVRGIVKEELDKYIQELKEAKFRILMSRLQGHSQRYITSDNLRDHSIVCEQ